LVIPSKSARVASLTNAELKKLRMSRTELQRCFAEGVKLMEGKTESDRCRPCADETLNNEWVVNVVYYSVHGDPLMNGPPAGRA
jgi:hypothetical protein